MCQPPNMGLSPNRRKRRRGRLTGWAAEGIVMGLLDHGHASSLEKGNPPNFKTHLQRQNHPFFLCV